MSRSANRILFSVMMIIFLVTACAPAPAATQDSALIRQVVNQALTAAAQNALTAEPQIIAPSPATTEGIPGSVETANITDSVASTPESVNEFPDVPDAITPASEPVQTSPNETETPTNVCNSRDVNPVLPTQLKVGDTATIKHLVNLRAQPSLRNRILLTLKPGAQVEIIAASPLPQTFAEGGEYFWWQVKLPGGLIGWSAEISLCHQYYFMEPVK